MGNRCDKIKGADAFSTNRKKDLTEHMRELEKKKKPFDAKLAKYISCISCTPQQVVELTCNNCDITKDRKFFSKNEASKGKDAAVSENLEHINPFYTLLNLLCMLMLWQKCLKCVLELASLEPRGTESDADTVSSDDSSGSGGSSDSMPTMDGFSISDPAGSSASGGVPLGDYVKQPRVVNPRVAGSGSRSSYNTSTRASTTPSVSSNANSKWAKVRSVS